MENNNNTNNNSGNVNNQQNNNTNNQQNNNSQNDNQNNSQQNNNTNVQTVDLEKAKKQAREDFLKSLGIEDENVLGDIVKKHKANEEANKTDLQKAETKLTEVTNKLADEKKARVIAEAKLAAIQQDAKPEMVDGLIAYAMTMVTKDKDIMAVVAEIKASSQASAYFVSEEDNQNGNKNSNITRKKPVNNNAGGTNENKPDGEQNNQGNNNNEGSLAKRLLKNRGKNKKSSYFSN